MYSVAEDTVYMVYILGSNFNLVLAFFWIAKLNVHTISTVNVGFVSYSTQNYQF